MDYCSDDQMSWCREFYYLWKENQRIQYQSRYLHKAHKEVAKSVLSNLLDKNSGQLNTSKGQNSPNSAWPGRYGKKFENFRQTVVRHFKKCMKKISSFSNSSNETEYEAFVFYLKAEKRFKKTYRISEDISEEFRHIFGMLRQVVSNNSQIFEANNHTYKSCNSAYVDWLFSQESLRELYAYHHKYAMKSGLYYEVLQVSTDIDQENFYNFIKNLPDYKDRRFRNN